MRDRGLREWTQVRYPGVAVPDRRPTWVLVLDAIDRLTDRGYSQLRLSDLIAEVQRADPERGRTSIQSVIQGMTANAGRGPASPCGKVLIRVAHGEYERADEVPLFSRGTSHPVRSTRSNSPGRDRNHLQARIGDLIARFDDCVRAYDENPPFVRFDQLESHRRTIDRRRALGGVGEAIHDDRFTASLYETLRRWGMGQRRSILVPLLEFRLALRGHVLAFSGLEPIQIHAIASDPMPVANAIARLIADLDIVDNWARIVPGTKTLHHLLPDLVPPMDREWTARFFGWTAFDMQYRQAQVLGEGFVAFSAIAAATDPARWVGSGWKTSPTKVLDNALIGYLQLARLEA